jgi:nicotinate-nucleotide pyrophosphorylase (carboxylating)
LEIGWRQIEEVVDRALAEDLRWGDVTTGAIIPADLRGRASMMAKARGILAGVEVARLVFRRVDPSTQFDIIIQEGNDIQPGDPIAKLEGKVASILEAERTALNFLQRLSGIATETRRYVEAIKGLDSRIVDTRKTTPGMRVLEKYAVRVGGGHNHRLHLGDGVLIKDNHLAALRSQGLAMKDIIDRAREKAPFNLKVEVEVRTAQEAVEAVEAGADIVMLDDMGLEEMRQAVRLVKGRALLEASGGITLDNVRHVAEIGVDLISIGALTHSARSLDISLEM